MLLAAIVLAAIITEKNGTFADAPATAARAVASPFIPYGTYTDGSGSTEYKRVGTNFVGAVSSMIDGFWERVAIPYGWLPEDLATGDAAELAYPVREAAKDTKRLVAWLAQNGEDSGGSWLRDYLEETLAYGYVYEHLLPGPGWEYQTNALHGGVAGSMTSGKINSSGLRFVDDAVDPVVWYSRKAEGVFAPTRPPIAAAWSGELPFKAAASNDWRTVFPVYSAYEYDPHFFPSNVDDMVANVLDYDRPHLARWMTPAHLRDIWGGDVYGANGEGSGSDLMLALHRMPVATDAVMESVLKIDPGWEYNYPPQLTNDYWMVGAMKFERGSISGEGGEPGSWDDLAHAAIADWIYKADPLDWQSWYYVTWNAWYGGWVYRASGEADIVVSGEPTAKSVDFGNGIVATKTEFWNDADDFKHWRNMTTRLDWKRLGIIAQLERHMEITYRAREREDYLPLWDFFVRSHRTSTGVLPLHIEILDGNIASAYVVGHPGSLSLQYVNWSGAAVTSNVETNRIGECYPTARSVVKLEGSQVRSSSSPAYLHGDFSIRDDSIMYELESAIERFVDPKPTGAKRFLVECSASNSSIGFSRIFVWFGEGDVRSFECGEYPIFYLIIPDIETDGDFDLVRDDSKVATDVTTLGNNATQEYRIMGRDIPAAYPDVMSAPAVSNLESTLWGNYIKKISLPTVEVRLAASNNYWAASRDALPAMPYIGQAFRTNANARAFRYHDTIVDAQPLDEFRWMRLVSLRDLDTEVKSHFRNFAGREITSGLNARATFAAGEIALMDAKVDQANAAVALERNALDGRMWIEGTFDFGSGYQQGDTATAYIESGSGGTLSTNSYQMVYADPNYTSHAYGSWAVTVSASAIVAATNAGVRVDGHQNEMMKTLWKFKNLRDPEL